MFRMKTSYQMLNDSQSGKFGNQLLDEILSSILPQIKCKLDYTNIIICIFAIQPMSVINT